MEQKKEWGGPRDMLDDALLRQILSDMDDNDISRTGSRCGCRNTRQTGDTDESRSGCGCSRNRRDGDENESHSGCGCSRNRRDGDENESRSGCGCSRNRRNRNNDSIYGRSDSTNGNNRCGCEYENTENVRERTDDCGGCVSGRGMPRMTGFPLAMVYSPNQDWEDILEEEAALANGTLFGKLIFPWYPSRCNRQNDRGGCCHD